MKNISELRNELAAVFSGLKAGTVEVKAAEAMNNTAGKIINTVGAELKYRELTGNKASIDFLEYSNEQPGS